MRSDRVGLIIIIFYLSLFSVYGQESLNEQENEYSRQREEMIRNIVSGTGLSNEDIIRTFSTVPRHRYVPEEYRNMAYDLTPLPVSSRVILPSPETLAVAFTNADLTAESRVLIIGLGTDYTAALLAQISGFVCVSDPGSRIGGFSNVRKKNELSWKGWTDRAPFDFIFIHYAVSEIPPVLTEQLTDNGILIFPLLTESGLQTMVMLKKNGSDISLKNLGDCFFTVNR